MQNDEVAPWERQQQEQERQRSVRLLFISLCLLILLDDENAVPPSARGPRVDKSVLEARKVQDQSLRSLSGSHARYQFLQTQLNDGVDVQTITEDFARHYQPDEFDTKDPLDPFTNQTKVWHFPWNTTGFYRGEWQRQETNHSVTRSSLKPKAYTLEQLQYPMRQLLQNTSMGVMLLPDNVHVLASHNESMLKFGHVQDHDLPLTMETAKIALHIQAKSVPGMQELSLVSGLVKLYDSLDGYSSSQRDVLLRVQGLAFHSIGQLHLVTQHSDSLLVTHDTNQSLLSFPYVPDPRGELQFEETPLPRREQTLLQHAQSCNVRLALEFAPVEWELGSWRRLLFRKFSERQYLWNRDSEEQRPRRLRRRRRKKVQFQALVEHMVGTIQSDNCHFAAAVNVTAQRTDWDATTSKTVNYSFAMMLVCLTQILVLLRQLLHSQSSSVAARVSLLCIAWQAVLDALLCLGHIYLSLVLSVLFTAFASVAFFKLLIFCVIEMKYMAILLQARDNNGPNESLRRQVAILHVRFYGVLMVVFLLLFYVSDAYRTGFLLLLYSFWVPQIVRNVITEARNPLHIYYIYGMSITRLIAPIYFFAIQENFLKEVRHETTTDVGTLVKIILWVSLQTAVLVAQSKYGTRFMIPARFLPPKFDYSRPLPSSMLPPGALMDVPSVPEYMEGRDETSPLQSNGTSAMSDHPMPSRHATADTTRNRLKASVRPATITMVETVNHAERPTAPTLECSICYEPVDVRDRKNYMLAPCNHIYHRSCLEEWMKIKMECPVCRTQLPAL